MHVYKEVKAIPASITWMNSTRGIALEVRKNGSLWVLKNYRLTEKKILKLDF